MCFDVDSTVLTEEGIDVLAAHLGKGAEVAALTSAAMNGGLPFRIALRQRLELLQPSESAITDCLAAHPLQLTPGFLSLLHLLRTRHKLIFLVTGGFIQMLHHLLPVLDIAPSHVYANHLLFKRGGQYAGFDPSQPTSTTGGKAHAIASLMEQHRLRSVVMVGDGMTDVEARPPAACMVGYGGVVERQAVREKADWFVHDWAQLMFVFESEDERREREQCMRLDVEDAKRLAGGERIEGRPPPPWAAHRPPAAPVATAAAAPAAVGVKKPRKPRSDKGVKRVKRKSEAEEQPADRPEPATQPKSKEQRVAEAAQATSCVDEAMAEWSFLSSPTVWH